jgi:hypothetical protein
LFGQEIESGFTSGDSCLCSFWQGWGVCIVALNMRRKWPFVYEGVASHADAEDFGLHWCVY